MSIQKTFLFFVLLIFLLLIPFSHASADSIVLKSDGKILFLTDTGVLRNFIFSHEHATNSRVLGASSGVTITVSLSSFLPTDTPVPTTHPTATPTPRPTSSQTTPPPTLTPTPANNYFRPSSTPTTSSVIPTPTKTPTLIATITTPSATTTQPVNQVTEELPNENPIVITPSSSGSQIVITQGETQATTDLTVQLNSENKTLHALVAGVSYPIFSPAKAMQIIQSTGSYILPSGITINLTSEKSQPIYKVTGKQHVQILGVFIVDFPVTLVVSAAQKTNVQVRNPFVVNLLEFLHIGRRVLH